MPKRSTGQESGQRKRSKKGARHAAEELQLREAKEEELTWQEEMYGLGLGRLQGSEEEEEESDSGAGNSSAEDDDGSGEEGSVKTEKAAAESDGEEEEEEEEGEGSEEEEDSSDANDDDKEEGAEEDDSSEEEEDDSSDEEDGGGTAAEEKASEKKLAAARKVEKAKPQPEPEVAGSPATSATSKPKRMTLAEIRAKRKGLREKRSDGLYPCDAFDQNGSCKFGAKCKFSHLGVDDVVTRLEAKAMSKRKKRNAYCLSFQDTGECKYGAKCRYKHVQMSEQAQKRAAEDREIALALQGDDVQEDKLKRIMELPEHLRQKARAVFFSKQRSNGFGPNKYGGGDNKNVPSRRKGVCYAFLRGECDRGEECIFRHDDGTGERDSKSLENWKAYKEKADAAKLAAKAAKLAAVAK